MNEFWGVLLFLVAAGAIVLLGALSLIARLIPDSDDDAPPMPHRRMSNVIGPDLSPYVDDAPVRSARVIVASALPAREAEAEVRREVRPEGGMGIVSLTEKALQERDRESYERGMIAAFAVFQGRGYIPAGKASELKRDLFAVAGGRRLQALNAAIDAVPVPADDGPAPRQTPVAGRELAEGVAFPQ